MIRSKWKIDKHKYFQEFVSIRTEKGKDICTSIRPEIAEHIVHLHEDFIVKLKEREKNETL